MRPHAKDDRHTEDGWESEGDTNVSAGHSIKGKETENLEGRNPKNRVKRSSKNAPMEISSKKPVGRKRTIIDVKTIKPRDPRFLPMAGEFSSPKFHSQYGFLRDLHSDELQMLKDSYRRAKALLVSTPRHMRSQCEEEVRRLEIAVKRAESKVNRDRLEKIEMEAMSRTAKEEKEKRRKGKSPWYMKQADKRSLVTRARFEALAASGGRSAVKKAIAKKQKRLGQSEKKARPFVQGQSDKSDSRGAVKRSSRSDDSLEYKTKRRRLSV